MHSYQRLFSADAFRRMKPTAYIINTARGEIVDELALAKALDAGRLAGAALDVMPKEPPLSSPPFRRGNVIITPHTSFYSEESLVELQPKRRRKSSPCSPAGHRETRSIPTWCSTRYDTLHMKAMVLRAPGDLVADASRVPRQTLRVRVTHGGICGTDLT